MVKKEVFKWIENRQKHVEIRKGKPMQGDKAVFQCGKCIIRRKIVSKQTGQLADLLNAVGFKNAVPNAESLEEAIRFYEDLGYSAGTQLTAYVLA